MNDRSKLVGDYELYNLVGRGNFATVWFGKHKYLGFPVAIKRFSKAEQNSQEILATMQREVMIMRLCDHPFIAGLYDIIETPKYYYVIIEYAENGTLLEYVNREGPLSEQDCRKFFIEIIAILQYLHVEKRIVHRDLKAENILLDKNNHLRLIDFGLSNIINQTTACLNTVCGSPAYVAPEILRNLPYTHSADIWSAGVLLYAVNSNTLPFNDKNMGKLVSKILTEEPEIPAKFSAPLSDLIRKMLQKDPADRITLDGIISHPWVTSFRRPSEVALSFKCLSRAKLGADRVDFIPDPAIIAELEHHGFDTSQIQTLLMGCKILPETAAYKGLFKEQMKDVLPSAASEIESSAYDLSFGFPGVDSKLSLGFLPPLSGAHCIFAKHSTPNMLSSIPSKGRIVRTIIPKPEVKVKMSMSHPNAAYVPGVLYGGKFGTANK